MARWLHMRDYLTVKKSDFTFKNKDSKGESLLTRVRATTAGIVNGNRRFYRPDRMMMGVDSWLPKKPRSARPVLIGHDEEGTPLGRVVEAKYIDESFKYKNEFTQIRDAAFYNTDSKKKIDVYKSIDWIVENLMPKDEYTGLGYIELGLKITHPDAIQKVLREEYLTVSVGFKTDSGICSICHTDWAQDDRCEHALGEVYDDKTMFLVSGHFEYDEVSFVNFPADPFASALSSTSLKDAQWTSERNTKMFFLGLPARQQAAIARSTGLQFSDSLYAADIQIAEETMPEDTVDLKLAAEMASVASKEMSKEEQDAAVAEATGTVAKKDCKCGCNGEGGCIPTLDEIEEADRAFFSDEEELYNQLWAEVQGAVKEDPLLAGSDAKLSSEKRKGLSGSTFCGPNRSFPVPDCAHVTAARRLIGRAKVSEATKSKILSCVSRKAKSLGCGSKGKDAQITERASKIIQAVLGLEKCKGLDSTGPEIAGMISQLDKAYDGFDPDKRYVVRMAVSSMLDDWYADGQMEYYSSQLTASKDYTLIKKSELQEQKDALTAKDSEVHIFKNQAASSFLNYKKGLASQIVMFKALGGDKAYKGLDNDQLQEKIKELVKRHVTSLQDTVSDIMSELKWTEGAAVAAAAPEVKATDATREEKPAEAPATTVHDNTQVVEPVPGASKEADAAGAQRDFELHVARLAAMRPSERTIYIAELAYQAQAKNQR